MEMTRPDMSINVNADWGSAVRMNFMACSCGFVADCLPKRVIFGKAAARIPEGGGKERYSVNCGDRE